MTVYVDDMYRYSIGRFKRMKMSHMTADTTEELLDMADRLGLRRSWIQNEGEWSEHFDVSLSKRSEAVAAGAVEISMRESAVNARRRWEERNP